MQPPSRIERLLSFSNLRSSVLAPPDTCEPDHWENYHEMQEFIGRVQVAWEFHLTRIE